jgi:hypothetical protein
MKGQEHPTLRYPFIVIALLLLSRSKLFGNYPPDAPILITSGISLVVGLSLLGCCPARPKRRESAQDAT